jgi:spermidine synthase
MPPASLEGRSEVGPSGPRPDGVVPRTDRIAVPLFFLVSGFSALVYQVLWLRELGLLIGNTVQAATVGLAIFFAGLAAGGQVWGHRAPAVRQQMRTYAFLELGIAATALFYFWLIDLYHWAYGPLYGMLGHAPGALFGAKLGLAFAVFFAPSFLMGGTFPILGQHVIRNAERLGRTGAFLYGLSTLGAALGALAAGFYLPLAFGFHRAYLLAMAINVGIGLAAFWLSVSGAPGRVTPPRQSLGGPAPLARAARAGSRHGWSSVGLAFASGGLTLGLEVVCTRMFAQVLQNSVYTFSTILVVFLVALALGALGASLLARLPLSPFALLLALLAAAGIGVAVTPFAFFTVTDGMRYLGTSESWTLYTMAIFADAGLVLLGPGILVGTVFPFLLRLEQDSGLAVGRAIGRLVAWNAAGAIAGATLTGFVLLPHLGLWGTFRLFAAVYLLLALLMYGPAARNLRPMRLAPIAGLLLLFTTLDSTRLPLVRVDAAAGERLLGVWEGAHGVTAVVERRGDRRIKVNNYYSLGGTAALEHQRNQTLIPLMAHPSPASVFFLGMGTGITAGAALQPAVQRVVVTELIPEVIAAARDYFGAAANGLFDDPRVQILGTGGRRQLAASREQFDAIIADLFIPWEAGTGSLYTREHFETARARLKPGGIYVQWLPLYQVSEREFMIIARTMLEVFPDVVLWRGDYFPTRPILALVGSLGLEPMDPEAIVRRGLELTEGHEVPVAAFTALTIPFYAGNLAAARQLVPPGPVNTDDRPMVEYLAPITHREQRAGAVGWFSSVDLLDFFDRLLGEVPPEQDPFLSRLAPGEREYVRAGFHRYGTAVYRQLGERPLADAHAREFEVRMPPGFRGLTSLADAVWTWKRFPAE